MTVLAAAVIVAAGEGSRAGGQTPKQFTHLGGIAMLEWSIRTFGAHRLIGHVVVVLAPTVLADPPDWLACHRITLVAGGESRQASVALGLRGVPEDCTSILVHDAARPFVSHGLIDRVLGACGEAGAVPGVPVRDTLKRVAGLRVAGTVDRSSLVAAQTPQGFPAGLLRRLHDSAARQTLLATDDAMLCEGAGEEVVVVPGDDINFKITTPTDFAYARWLVDSGVVIVPPVAG